MELFVNISSIFILFSCALTLLMGVEQLAGRAAPARYNLILFSISIPVSVILFNHVMFGNAVTPHYPGSAFFYFTSVYAIGPLTNMYYHFLMYPGKKIRVKRFRRFVPAAVVFVVEIVLHSQPDEVKREALDRLFYSSDVSMLLALLLVGGTIFVVYQVIVIVEGLMLWNDKKIGKGVRLVVTLEIMNSALPVPIIIWMFTRQHFLFLVSGCLTSIVMMTVFLTNNRFPQIFNLMKRELVRRKYERSFLRGLNTESIRARLVSLMEDDKLYRDSELTLQSLAATLRLTPHQLSQFLNEKMRTSFTAYINRHRVEEAKRLLAGDAVHTVLTICFLVGFNSKSSFNTVFKKFTGRTPSRYRDEALRKSG